MTYCYVLQTLIAEKKKGDKILQMKEDLSRKKADVLEIQEADEALTIE